MVRRIVVLILVLSGSLLTGRAQEGTRVADGDTLHYTYTPLPQEAPRKKPFLRRVLDYFGESTTDKTFEKKIDFTFAGGPSYSKNTSFGIGLLAAGLFRLDRTDSITAPSDISIFANVSVSGFYALGVTGNNIFSHNKRRINYTVMFASAPICPSGLVTTTPAILPAMARSKFELVVFNNSSISTLLTDPVRSRRATDP